MERIEALEEEQHQLISDVQSKISNVPPLTWTIASVGIPLGILGWYSYSLWSTWKRNGR